MALLLLLPDIALAHAGDRAHIMVLPTGYYLLGGAIAVALSFIVLALVPPGPLERQVDKRLGGFSLPVWPRLAGSVSCLLLVLFLLYVGVAGSRDPLSNPLPLMVWTVFWIGLTLLQGVFGNLWWWINPLYAPWRLAAAIRGSTAPLVVLPRRLGYWPAIALFFGFAWFELVYPAPDDPERLALVLGVYLALNIGAAIIFGYEEWTRRGECLSVFLGMIARMGVIEASDSEAGWRRVRLCWPGAKLASAQPLPPTGAAFLLLALSTVSFDGLLLTFFWLSTIGINPLEFPGRTDVMLPNTVGLFAMFALLAGAFFASVWIGERLARGKLPLAEVAGRLVWSIIPISLVYHFAHYLSALLVEGQYALAALSDPLVRGWDLFGTAGMHVQAGIVLGARATWVFWNIQAGAIIIGHLMAIAMAHVIAYRIHGNGRDAALSQVALAFLMVFYTAFGLWLLSSPTA
ncbi:MAG: hypothetical protein ACXIVF_07590 [Rhizobiaceae bacterium]